MTKEDSEILLLICKNSKNKSNRINLDILEESNIYIYDSGLLINDGAKKGEDLYEYIKSILGDADPDDIGDPINDCELYNYFPLLINIIANMSNDLAFKALYGRN